MDILDIAGMELTVMGVGEKHSDGTWSVAVVIKPVPTEDAADFIAKWLKDAVTEKAQRDLKELD